MNYLRKYTQTYLQLKLQFMIFYASAVLILTYGEIERDKISKYSLEMQIGLSNGFRKSINKPFFYNKKLNVLYFLYVGSIRKDLPQFLSLALILTDCLVAVRLKDTIYSWSDHGRSKAVRLDEQEIGQHTLIV